MTQVRSDKQRFVSFCTSEILNFFPICILPTSLLFTETLVLLQRGQQKKRWFGVRQFKSRQVAEPAEGNISTT